MTSKDHLHRKSLTNGSPSTFHRNEFIYSSPCYHHYHHHYHHHHIYVIIIIIITIYMLSSSPSSLSSSPSSLSSPPSSIFYHLFHRNHQHIYMFFYSCINLFCLLPKCQYSKSTIFRYNPYWSIVFLSWFFSWFFFWFFSWFSTPVISSFMVQWLFCNRHMIKVAVQWMLDVHSFLCESRR